MNWNRIAHVPLWIWSELVWYVKWWGDKFYSFGEWILGASIKLIDLHDQFWDKIEANVQEVFQHGVD